MARGVPVLVAACWALLVVPAGAGATALHGLTPQGCLSNAALVGCTTLAGQLDDMAGVAVSADGTSVYAAGQTSDTLVSLRRDPGTGALEPLGCFSNAAVLGCTTLAGLLDGPRPVAVSADGRSLYVGSAGSDAVLTFKRDTASGALELQGCASNAALAGCTTLPGQLDSPQSVTVSADGASVYVADQTSDTFVAFKRDLGSGAVEPEGCFSNGAVAGCTTLAGQLDGARSVAVSADGRSVYVTAFFSDTVVSFTRDPGSRVLAPQGCFSNAALAGCTTLSGQLDGAVPVAVTADGASVYVTAAFASTVVSFQRDSGTGVLEPQGCFSDAALAGCTTLSGQLDAALSVAPSPDGASVYVASAISDAVVSFTRSAGNGALTPQGCLSNAALAGCTTLAGQLDNALWVAVSADGASVYATSFDGDTLVSFKRELPPVCLGTTSSASAGATQTITLDCRDPNGEAIAIELVRSPRHGTLGAVDQAARTVTYTPAAGFDGADDLAIRATSDGKASDPAIVAITVTPPTPTGPAGPPGTNGAPGVSRLIALLTVARARVGRGKPLRLGYVATAGGRARLTVRKGRKIVAGASHTLRQAGRGTLMLRARATRELKPGRYRLRLAFTSPGADRVAVDTIALVVRR